MTPITTTEPHTPNSTDMPDIDSIQTHFEMEERFCFFILAKYGITVEQDNLGFWSICKDGVPIKDTWRLTDEHLQVNCFDGRDESIRYAFIAALDTARAEAIEECAKTVERERGKEFVDCKGHFINGYLMATDISIEAIRSLSPNTKEKDTNG